MEDFNLMSLKSIFCLLLFMLIALPLPAQPPRDRVLGDIDFSELPETAVVQVGFNFPVRYLNHFPADSGDELRIRLLPIAIAAVDRDALFHRESYSPPKPNLAGITEILYEGDNLPGLYLTIFFQNPAYWQVEQGTDYRSLIIKVRTPFPVTPEEVKGE